MAKRYSMETAGGAERLCCGDGRTMAPPSHGSFASIKNGVRHPGGTYVNGAISHVYSTDSGHYGTRAIPVDYLCGAKRYTKSAVKLDLNGTPQRFAARGEGGVAKSHNFEIEAISTINSISCSLQNFNMKTQKIGVESTPVRLNLHWI